MNVAVEARGLVRRFDDVLAVDDVTLQVPEGEVFGFLGPNGAGKSTTVKLLATLLAPTEGTARVAGHDVRDDPLAVRRRIGYLPERMPDTGRATAREHLRIFARYHGLQGTDARDRIEELLNLVNLPDVDGRLVAGFSKGMRQRLGLARALLHDPDVLFLDEPESGLDPTGRREMRMIMRDLADTGATIFLCTHDLAEAQAVCDRIGFLRDGALVRVRRAGDVDDDGARVLEVDLDREADAAARRASDAAGVRAADAVGRTVRLRIDPDAPRAPAMAAVQAGDAVVLDVRDRGEDLEGLYQRYVEGDAPDDHEPATFRRVDP